MYTEENARGKFPLRDILLKAIVVIIFIILIIFVISKLTAPSDNESGNKESNSNYDKVFNENLDNMKEVAFVYFTTDKLPTEVGETSEITLRNMVNSNLLEAFTDANGKSCDVNKSYIRLTKNENDYTLRVNLVCDEKEDYTLTKVGEYDYCEHDICERDSSKENTTKEEETTEPTKEVDITEPTNNSTTSNSAGNNNSYAYVPSRGDNTNNNTESKTTMYEYKKVTSPVLSGWSSWSDWQYNNDRYSAIKCETTDTSCLREVQLYSRREKIGTKDGKPVYATVNYYSYRTRTLISNGTSDIKWSTYNDTNLLNQGYTYTGNTR